MNNLEYLQSFEFLWNFEFFSENLEKTKFGNFEFMNQFKLFEEFELFEIFECFGKFGTFFFKKFEFLFELLKCFKKNLKVMKFWKFWKKINIICKSFTNGDIRWYHTLIAYHWYHHSLISDWWIYEKYQSEITWSISQHPPSYDKKQYNIHYIYRTEYAEVVYPDGSKLIYPVSMH